MHPCSSPSSSRTPLPALVGDSRERDAVPAGRPEAEVRDATGHERIGRGVGDPPQQLHGPEDRRLRGAQLATTATTARNVQLLSPALIAILADLRSQRAFPQLEVTSKIQPITRTVLRVELTLEAPFVWRDDVHGVRTIHHDFRSLLFLCSVRKVLREQSPRSDPCARLQGACCGGLYSSKIRTTSISITGAAPALDSESLSKEIHGDLDAPFISQCIAPASRSEVYSLTKKGHKAGPGRVAFTIPIFDPMPPQYYVHAINETWLHSETVHEARRGPIALQRASVGAFFASRVILGSSPRQP